MGGCNSPTYLQDRMDAIFRGTKLNENGNSKAMAPYMDDLMDSQQTIQEHKNWITYIFQKCIEYNIKLAPTKLLFFQKHLDALGRLVDGKRYSINEETRKKIISIELPNTVSKLQGVVGLANWGRPFMFDDKNTKFAYHFTKPLTQMYTENPPKLNWTPERIQAFEDLKSAVANSMKLHFFDSKKEIYMAADGSNDGWGAILFHLNDNGEKQIFAIASGSFNATERKWKTEDHEAKAIHNGFIAFKNYPLGRNFNLFTDNKNLSFIHTMSGTNDRIWRWADELGQFCFKVYHIPGRLNWETDFLSRIKSDTSLPIKYSLNAPTDHGGMLNIDS